jgi:hypothetical protein
VKPSGNLAVGENARNARRRPVIRCSWMRLAERFLTLLLSLSAICLSNDWAFAQGERTDGLISALRTAEDFRVRTQAALALGASADPRAVEPLCGALADGNTTVRAASASALGKLALGGEKCLSERLEAETNEDVKGVIARALERLGGGQPAVDGNTRFYAAIGDTTNKTQRSNASVNAEVRKYLSRELGRLSGFVVAPAGETTEQVRELKERFPSLKTVYLWPKLELGNEGGTLKLNLELSLFSYPEKAFIGSVGRRLSMPDTPVGDTASENQLIEMASEQLAPDLERTMSSL